MSDQPLGSLAKYLAQYWQHAMSARSRHLVDHRFESAKVIELTAYANWHNSSWSMDYKANHSLALHQIITRDLDEIRGIREKAKDATEEDDITYLLKMAQQLESEISSASELLEKLSGR